jgi:hypothetical protein
MTRTPHDVRDLYLAPVLLALEARLDEMGCLDSSELTQRVALASDRPDWTPELRATGLLRVLEHDIDLHGWEIGWSPRGLRVQHGRRSLTLGVPAVFDLYIAGPVQELVRVRSR